MNGFVSAGDRVRVSYGIVRAVVGVLVCGVVTFVLPVATMLPGTASAATADEAAPGHDEHGHDDQFEIGHNPPAGVSKKDFENPAEFREDLAIWSLAVFGLLLAAPRQVRLEADHGGARQAGAGNRAPDRRNQESQRGSQADARLLRTALSETADEVRGMLDEARRDGESTKVAIVAEARKAAEDEQARAKHEIGLARDEALSSIALKAGDLAVEVAGKFLREKIGKEDHSRLVRDSIASLGTTPSVN